MIENIEDKREGIDMGCKGNEKHFWQRMKDKLNLFDLFEGLKKTIPTFGTHGVMHKKEDLV